MRKKNLVTVIAGALVLSMLVAGCGSTGTNEGADAAATAAAAATTAAAAQEADEMAWQEKDDAYLTGVTAADYVELPEEYDKLHVQAAKPVDPTDEEVEARISAELQNRTTTEEVDRKVKEGDTVNIDFVGKIDGKEFEGGSGTYDLVIGSGSFIEGFEEGLIGAEKGETRDLNLTFPEDYHPEEGLNGKDVVFTVTVNKVSESITPELSDDFVKSLNLTNAFGQAVTDVDAYEDYMRSNMIEEREASYENNVKSAIVSEIVDGSTLKQDPPADMIDKYDYLLNRQLTYYALQYYMDLPTLMSSLYGATEDNYKDMIHDMAKNYALQGLAFQAIADKEDLNPDEEAVSTAIAEYVASDATVESVESLDRVIRESIRDELMTDKVIDWLYDRCKVEEPSEEEDSEEAGTAEAADTSAAAATEEAADAASGEAATSEEAAGENSTESGSAATGETAETASEGQTEDSAARHEN